MFIAFVSIVLAVLSGSGAPLLGLIAALSILVVSILMVPEEEGIVSELEADYKRLYVGEVLHTVIRVRNTGAKRAFISYNLEIPSGFEVKAGNPYGRVSIPPGSVFEEVLEVRCSVRGHMSLGPLYIEYGDPLGIYTKRVVAAHQMVISVLPKYMEPSTVEIRSMYTGAWPGSVRSRMKGRSLEFYSVREYCPGDEVRRINWRATGKHGRLMVNEYEDERVTDSVVIVDINGYSYETSYEVEVVESVISGAATVAAALLRQGNRVGMIIMGGKRIWIMPGFGKKHLLRILHGLAEAVPGKELDLSHVIALLVPFMLRRGTQVFIVSGLMDDTLPNAVEGLLSEGFSVVVVGVLKSFETNDDAWRAVSKLLEVEKMITVSEVRRLCPVVIWDGKARLPLAISKTLKTVRGVKIAPKR